jgi:thiol-disulfide isomerase/thioredoxin
MTTFRYDPRRASLWRRVAWIAGLILALLVVLLGLRVLALRSFDRTLPPKLAEIEKLPVSLPDGKTVSLRHLIRPGVPTLITLWATWCPPCRAEAPKIADLRKRFGPDSLNLLYLNVRDQFSSREEMSEFMRSYGMNADGYAVLDDTLIGKATNSKTNFIPRTMLFDREGQPVGTITGYNPIALRRMESLIGG